MSPISRSHLSNVQTIFSDGKNLSHHRFMEGLIRLVVIITLIANIGAMSPVHTASILVNYRKSAARATNAAKLPARSAVSRRIQRGRWKGETNTINLWNFKGISSIQLSSSSSATSNRASHRRLAEMGSAIAMTDSLNQNLNLVHPASVTNTQRRDQGDVYDDQIEDNYNQPSLEEMRAQLGPLGLMIANAVEVGVTTAGSYISGGLFGYFIGGAMGLPTLLRGPGSNNAIPPPNELIQNSNKKIPFLPQNKGVQEFQRRIGTLNSRALGQAKSWAQLSAAFSGFHVLTRVCRGGVEDKWNGIIGSAFTGAYLSRQGGPQAMLQGASTYAGFTYLLDTMFGGGGGGDNRERINHEFDFEDQPVAVDERGF